jgi:hypothetical protein
MRAHTEGKDEMGKRFTIVIGVAAAGVMALGAQTATSSTGEPVDSVKPDLQLSGPKKQDPVIAPGTDCGGNSPPLVCGGCDGGACAVKVDATCGDEACTARAKGKLTNVKNDKLKPGRLWAGDLHPGETDTLVLKLTKKSQRKQAGKAIAEGKRVQAKVTVHAKDAAGHVATAKRTIKLVK